MAGVREVGRRYTVAEYLAIDDASDERLEFCDGEIFGVHDGPRVRPDDPFAHAMIVANVARHVGRRLAGRAGVAVGMTVPAGSADVAVVVGEPQFDPPDGRAVLANPWAVFEVLSPSTAAADYGAKFIRRREVESLHEYALVAQDRPRVSPYYRHADGGWCVGPEVDGMGGVVLLRSLEIEVPMADIYEGLTFPAGPADDGD